MFAAVWTIARAQALIARNTFWRGKLSHKIGVIVVLLGLLGAGYGLYSLLRGAVLVLRSPEFGRALATIRASQPDANLPADFQPFLDALPSQVLFVMLIMLLLSSFSSVLSALYLSGDIETLLVAPVPMRAVFLVKFFGTMAVPYLLLFALLAPALLGYGQAMGYGPAFGMAALGVLALLPLLPAGLGALLVIGIVRIVPAKRARDIVGVLGGMSGMLVYLTLQLRPQVSRGDTVSALNALRSLDLPLLPTAWAGRALVAAGRGDWPTLAVYGTMFAALALGIFAACLVMAERLYYAGWANMASQGGRTRRRDGRFPARSARRSPLDLLPPESAAIVRKDLRMFLRDLRSLQQVIFPLVIAGIWVAQLIGGRTNDLPSLPETFADLAGVGIALYVCTTLSSALAGSGFNREARTFWLLHLAPASPFRLLLGKFVLAYLPFPTAGSLLVLVLAWLQQSSAITTISALGVLLIGGLGFCALGLAINVAFPHFAWSNPNRQSSIRAGCLGTVVVLGYVGLAGAAVFGLPLLGTFFPRWATLLGTLGWAVFVLGTALIVWLSFAIGANRLAQIEER